MLLQALMSLSLSNLMFSLFLVIMARSKHTPKNPQLHRPVTAIGKDVQPPRKDIPPSPKKRRKTT